MKLQFFSINALEPEAQQEAIDAFCSQHRLVSIDKQLIEKGDNSFWSICITYLDSPPLSKSSQALKKRTQVDYREVLSEQDFAIYAKLRTLRKEIAESEGVPAYALFTNAQLAEMVTGKVVTKTALGKIEGVGAAKLDKYAKPFLTVLNASFVAEASSKAAELVS